MAAAWPYPRAIAHRGGGSLAPENTLEALEVGWQHGFRGAELDAVLSADGVPVLLHDATLERTTDGRGPVELRTAAELALLDAGSWFGAAFAGARVPTLERTLAHCAARGIWLNVEVKPAAGFEAATGRAVARMVAGCAAQFRAAGLRMPLLSSFSRAALEAAADEAPGLARGMLYTAIPPDWRETLRALECVSLHCDHRRLTAARARRVREQGFGLLCYTVNDLRRAATLWSWGVDCVCTDRIDRIPAGGPS